MTRYFYYLIILIAIGTGVAFTQAIDCVFNWIGNEPNGWFELASFWYFVLSIPFMALTVKYSTLHVKDDINIDNENC